MMAGAVKHASMILGTEADKIEARERPEDRGFMLGALALARRGLGRVAPNPAVGCVLVQQGADGVIEVVGRGWTQSGGRPHAETEALARAGNRARGATAYVTLEPCAHWGETGPCVEALVAAGIARAVIAMEDPDPRVSGRGVSCLRAAGIPVVMGMGGSQAADINAGFLTRLEKGRPLVTLKIASSLDGRIATASGESRWITGEQARARAHMMRAEHDAVLIGSGTAIADDPELTCRLPGLEDRSPIRVVVDRRLRLPVAAKILASTYGAAWIVTREDAAERGKTLADRGAVIIALPGAGPDAVLKALGDRGLTRVLVEGGGTLAASFLRDGLVDRIAWFRSSSIIGGDGRPAVADLGLALLEAAPAFNRVAVERLGEDVLETLCR